MTVLLFHFIPHLLSKLRMKRQLVPWKEFKVRKLRRALLNWYGRNRRELPWRRDADPYRVWVSEIMLQQTRVGGARPLRAVPREISKLRDPGRSPWAIGASCLEWAWILPSRAPDASGGEGNRARRFRILSAHVGAVA